MKRVATTKAGAESVVRNPPMAGRRLCAVSLLLRRLSRLLRALLLLLRRLSRLLCALLLLLRRLSRLLLLLWLLLLLALSQCVSRSDGSGKQEQTC